MPYEGKKRSKSLLLSPGLRPCSPMCMLSQVSELPCLTIPIRLVCPQADRKASKQNSCPWQYKMSLQRRLLTVTSDLPGACPMAYCPPGSICGMLSIPRALPPVTQGSALQAPECMWSIIRGRILSRGQETLHQARILLWLQGSLFFTANGSYFDFWGFRRSCKAGLGVAAQGCCQDAS